MKSTTADERQLFSLGVASVQRVGLYGVAAMLFVAFLALFVATVYLPPNPLSPQWSPIAHQSFSQILPEGWGFFTRSQREEYITILSQDRNGHWADSFPGPQAQPRWLFGLRRNARAASFDLGSISSALPAQRYHTCDLPLTQCFSRLPRLVVVRNRATQSLICGHVLLVWRKPVPWNWATFQRVRMPLRFANLKVECTA